MRTIDLSKDSLTIEQELKAALLERIEKEGAEPVINHLLGAVLGHSFVDDELEIELQETIAEVAGAEFINSPNDGDFDGDDFDDDED
jgi:hypothetical protein